MGAWLGALGGLGMIALILALLTAFLRDMGIPLDGGAPRCMARAALIVLAMLMVAGLYHRVGVASVSLLDLRATWSRLPFWLPGLWPFNAYAALLMGAWTAWCVRRALGGQAMHLFLACPGCLLLFLPAWPAAAGFAAALGLRLALQKQTPRALALPQPLYLALLAALSLANGLFVIAVLGGHPA